MYRVALGLRLLCQVCAGFLFLVTASSAADVSLSNFTLESSERIRGIPATWDLTYQGDLTNTTGENLSDARMVIDAPPDVIEVIEFIQHGNERTARGVFHRGRGQSYRDPQGLELGGRGLVTGR